MKCKKCKRTKEEVKAHYYECNQTDLWNDTDRAHVWEDEV